MSNHDSRPQRPQIYRVITLISVVVLTFLGIWLAFALLRPTPPRSIAMAVGPKGSFNADLAERYRELLARDGIKLRLVSTAGAVESLARLQGRESDVDIAILPGGITSKRQSHGLVSLGTLFYEPLWIFSRHLLNRYEQLRGLRIAIGPVGSGAHALSIEFLSRVGIINQKSATLLPLTPQESAPKLLDGEIDGEVLLDAWESPVVQQLLSDKNVNLNSVHRASAFVALYPYLNKLVFPAGMADLPENRPPSDVVLLAPKASLVVRSDLHPAIQFLLLEAASEIHSGPGVFNKEGQFPAPESIDFPLSKYGRQFYKSGPPFLQRHLPFWLAVLMQQLFVLLIPIVGFLYPLLRFAPLVYLWFEHRPIYRLYSELKVLDQELSSDLADEHREAFFHRLDRLEERASLLPVPTALGPILYGLRSHINVVREKAQKPAPPKKLQKNSSRVF